MEDQESNFNIEDDLFLSIAKKALVALDNLCQTKQIDFPVQPQILLDLAIGAVAESQISEKVNLLGIFFDHQEFMLDTLYFEKEGEYGLYDVMSQVVCFRIVSLLEEYLDHTEIEYKSVFKSKKND